VYHRIENKDPDVEEVELKDITSNDTTPAILSEQPQQKRKKSMGRKCFKCIALSYCFFILASTLVLLIVSGVAAYRVKHCVFPKAQKTNSFTYNSNVLDTLTIDIPSGSISVHTCSHATNVSVQVTTGASTPDLMEKIKVAVMQGHRSLSIIAQGPSFNMHNCQVMHIMVTIPAASKHQLSLSASVNVGLIKIQTGDYVFNNVDAKVNVGLVKARHLSAQTISTSAALGGIVGCHWNANQSVSVHASVGGACLYSITGNQSSFHVEKGYLRSRRIESTSVKSKVDFGFSVLNDIKADSLTSEIGYGRLSVEPNPSFAGTVIFSSQNGASFDLSGARGVVLPAVLYYEQPTPSYPTQQVQQIQVKGEGNAKAGKFELKSLSGNVDVYLRRQ